MGQRILEKEIANFAFAERSEGNQSPSGAFIVPLRSTNANLYIKENIDETVFMFALFKCRKSDKGRN